MALAALAPVVFGVYDSYPMSLFLVFNVFSPLNHKTLLRRVNIRNIMDRQKYDNIFLHQSLASNQITDPSRRKGRKTWLKKSSFLTDRNRRGGSKHF